MTGPTIGPTDSFDEARMQTLLFNTVTVFLAAASLVVACIHFILQRKKNRAPQGGMYSCSELRTEIVNLIA
jgi:hypothetical protein